MRGDGLSVIASFLGALPQTWKALTALGGAMAIGFTVATVVQGGKIERNAEVMGTNARAIARNAEAIRQLALGDSLILARISRTNCLLTLTDDSRERIAGNPLIAERECP